MKLSSLKNLKYHFLKVLDKKGLLQSFNFKSTKKIKGTKFIIPVINGIGYQHFTGFESWAAELYKRILENFEGTFIDVGVNNGQTILKIAAVNPEQSYFGFEPNPVCYYYSRKLIALNHLSSFKLFPVGLHTENKIVELFHDNEFAAGASILPNFRENKKKYNQVQNVMVMRGDEIILQQNPSAICFLKIDVEGAELEVVSGLKETINKYKPIISLEILPVYSLEKENGRFRKERQDALLAVMFSFGYKMMLINEHDLTLTPLTDIEIHNDMGRTNYLFVPEEKTKKITEIFY
jgi:FkbM family methyltransferase